MQPTNTPLCSTLNQIHRWSEPERNPMIRMFLTRISEIGCAAIEIGSIAFKCLNFGTLVGKQLALCSIKALLKVIPESKQLQKYSKHPSFYPEIKRKGQDLCKLIAGFISTLCIGIIFSPEANFKVHLQLKLVVDNLAEKNQRKLAVKLQAELKKIEIAAARKDRFEKFQAETLLDKQRKAEANAVESRLAELLLPERS